MISDKTHGRNLAWQVHLLGHGHSSLLERAFQVDVLNLFAEIHSLPDQGDETIFDNNVYRGAGGNAFVEDARGGDSEGLATIGDDSG